MWDTVLLWVIVLGYLAFIFIKGVSKSAKIKDSDDYLVSGRNVGWFALFCTMGATVVGGGASIGAIGRTYEWGILMLLVSTGWYFHFIFSGLVVAPKFRKAELYTVAGYFGHRYDERSRFVVMILSLLFSVFIVAAQMAAFGSVISALFPGMDTLLVMRFAIVIGGLMVVVYSTAGGLMAVISTDVYQFIILIIGFVITSIACLQILLAGDFNLMESVPKEFLNPHGGKGWLFLITTFLAFFFGETFAPGYATRYCVGKNVKETKKGIAGVGLFLAMLLPAVLFIIALFARIEFPGIDPQQALPLVVEKLNNPLFGGLIIGALLMAVMSSADSALNSATAIFVKDLFEHQFGWDNQDDKKILLLARLCTIGLGVVAIITAILWPNIIDLLLVTYHLWAPAIIIPVAFGAISKMTGRELNTNIFFVMVISVFSTLIYKFLPDLNILLGGGLLGEEATSLIKTIDPAVFGVALSLVLFLLLQLMNRGKPA
jgi:SSS family solute:Na+ symporter